MASDLAKITPDHRRVLRKRDPRPRTSLAEPTLYSVSPPRKKRKRVGEVAKEFWAAKAILEERHIHGRLEYRIDWEDNQVTGEAYPASWEPASHVTVDLVQSWEEEQRSRRVIREISSPSYASSACARTSEKSPVHVAIAAVEDPTKRPRRAGSVKSARFQTVSEGCLESTGAEAEIKDSYEEELDDSSVQQEPRVEIQVSEDFNRDEYIRIRSSQLLTQGGTQSTIVSSLPPTASLVEPPSPPSTHQPWIWDEPIADIPDSQEQTESFRLSDSVASAAETKASTERLGLRTESDFESVPCAETPLSPSSLGFDSETHTRSESSSYQPSLSQVSRPADKHQNPQNSASSAATPVLSPGIRSASAEPVLRLDISSQTAEAAESGTKFARSIFETNESLQSPRIELGSGADSTQLSTSSRVATYHPPSCCSPQRRSEHTRPQPCIKASDLDRNLIHSIISANRFLSKPQSQEDWSRASLDSQEKSSEPAISLSQAIEPRVTKADQARASSVPCSHSDQNAHSAKQLHRETHSSVAGLIPGDTESNRSPHLPSLKILDSPFRHAIERTGPKEPTPEDWYNAPASAQNSEEAVVASVLDQIHANSQKTSVSSSQRSVVAISPAAVENQPHSFQFSSSLPPLSKLLQSIESEAICPANTKAVHPTYSSPNTAAASRPSSGVKVSASLGTSSKIPLGRLSAPFDFEMAEQPQTETGATEKMRKAREEAIARRHAAVQGANPSQISQASPEYHVKHAFNASLTVTRNQQQVSEIKKASFVTAMSSPTDSRSPSAVSPPDSIPSHPVINQLLPVRDTNPELAEDETRTSRSPTTSDEDEVEAETLRIPPLDQNQFVVPLPMVSRTRDVYESIICNFRSGIESFIGADSPVNQDAREKMEELIDQLKKVGDYQDLLADDTFTQFDDRIQARYAEDISTKCMFLKEILDALRESKENVAVLARPGKMMHVLQAILKTYDHNYTCEETDHVSSGRWPLKVFLVPTGSETRPKDVVHATVLIGFDSSFTLQDISDSLRSSSSRQGEPAPILQLVIANSAEHVDLCLNRDLKDLDRQLCLVSYVTQLRKAAGVLSHNSYPSTEAFLHKERAGFDKATEHVAAYLSNPNAGWPLPRMPDIKGLKSPIRATATQQWSTGEETRRGSATQSNDTSIHDLMSSSSNKRTATSLSPEESTVKRQRMIPRKEDLEMQETHNSDTPGLLSDDARVTDLEKELGTKIAAEKELHDRIKTLDMQVRDYKRSLRVIEPKYQEAREDCSTLNSIKIKALQSETAALKIVDNLNTKVAILEAEILSLKAQKADLTAPTADVALRLVENTRALDNSMIEIASLQRKLTDAEKYTEYLKDQYNTASSKSREQAVELDSIRAKNERLKQKADENILQIHEFQRSRAVGALGDLNEELRGQILDLRGQIERLIEENRFLQAGRRGTRGASVPRSPRLGAIASPRNAIQMGRVWGSRSSRGNSPAPGIGESALGQGHGQTAQRGNLGQETLGHGAGSRFARG